MNNLKNREYQKRHKAKKELSRLDMMIKKETFEKLTTLAKLNGVTKKELLEKIIEQQASHAG